MGKRKRRLPPKRRWDGFVSKQGLDLDAAVWGQLPPDIHLNLFEHLPLPALLRFQVVCKAWYRGIRNRKEVTVHGDCYVAYPAGEYAFVSVYSSRDEGPLQVPQPLWAYGRAYLGTTGDGRLFFEDDKGGRKSWLYSLFTGEMVSIPSPPPLTERVIARVLGNDQPGEFTIIRVAGDGRVILVYESGRGTWGVSPLRLPAGEVFSTGDVPHATINGSTLYFLTVNLQTQKISSIRSIDFRRNLDGLTTKVSSWPSLPSCYVLYQDEEYYEAKFQPYGRPFTGNIATTAGGELFMACMRSVKRGCCTIALLAFDKQEKKWDFVSEMPLTKGFVAWEPQSNNIVELQSRGDILVACNELKHFACMYNTSTKEWSLFGEGAAQVWAVCPLKLSLRF